MSSRRSRPRRLEFFLAPLLGDGLWMWKSHLLRFLLYAAGASIPYALFVLGGPKRFVETRPFYAGVPDFAYPRSLMFFWTTSFWTQLTGMGVQALAVHFLFRPGAEETRGERPTRSRRRALFSLAWIVAAGVGFSIVCQVALMIAWLCGWFPDEGLVVVLSRILHALAWVPLWCAVPVALLERTGPVRRSWVLVRGRLLHVFIVVFSLGIVQEFARGYDTPFQTTEVNEWFEFVSTIAIASFAGVLGAVGYQRLRLEHEGVDVAGIERVF